MSKSDHWCSEVPSFSLSESFHLPKRKRRAGGAPSTTPRSAEPVPAKAGNRVLLFADYLSRGEHTYAYLARATTSGTFLHPPAKADLMYQPEINGNTGTGSVVVREGVGVAGRAD